MGCASSCCCRSADTNAVADPTRGHPARDIEPPPAEPRPPAPYSSQEAIAVVEEPEAPPVEQESLNDLDVADAEKFQPEEDDNVVPSATQDDDGKGSLHDENCVAEDVEIASVHGTQMEMSGPQSESLHASTTGEVEPASFAADTEEEDVVQAEGAGDGESEDDDDGQGADAWEREQLARDRELELRRAEMEEAERKEEENRRKEADLTRLRARQEAEAAAKAQVKRERELRYLTEAVSLVVRDCMYAAVQAYVADSLDDYQEGDGSDVDDEWGLGAGGRRRKTDGTEGEDGSKANQADTDQIMQDSSLDLAVAIGEPPEIAGKRAKIEKLVEWATHSVADSLIGAASQAVDCMWRKPGMHKIMSRLTMLRATLSMRASLAHSFPQVTSSLAASPSRPLFQRRPVFSTAEYRPTLRGTRQRRTSQQQQQNNQQQNDVLVRRTAAPVRRAVALPSWAYVPGQDQGNVDGDHERSRPHQQFKTASAEASSSSAVFTFHPRTSASMHIRTSRSNNTWTTASGGPIDPTENDQNRLITAAEAAAAGADPVLVAWRRSEVAIDKGRGGKDRYGSGSGVVHNNGAVERSRTKSKKLLSRLLLN